MMVRTSMISKLPTRVLRATIPALAMCLVPALSGCAERNGAAVVSGAVTVDGAPLASGQIRFTPADGQGPTAGGAIAGGQFSVTLAPGEKKVEISAPKVTGRQSMYNTPASPAVDVVVELLPPRYNVQTELRMIVEGGAQQQDFALNTK